MLGFGRDKNGDTDKIIRADEHSWSAVIGDLDYTKDSLLIITEVEIYQISSS